MFSLFGAGGQKAVNSYYRRRAEREKEEKEGGGFLASKWSPVTKLSDEEYEGILREKLLEVEVQLALLDEQIDQVKASQAQSASPKKADPPSSESTRNDA